MASNTVDARIAWVLLLFAATKGLQIEELCARYQINPALFSEPDSRISAVTVATMWRELPALCQDPNFGLHLAAASREHPQEQSLMLLLMRSCETVGDSLRLLARFERVQHDVEPHEITLTPTSVRLSHSGGQGALQLPKHAIESFFAILLYTLRTQTGQAISPLRVEFIHERPAELHEHLELLGITPSFGCERHAIEFEGAIQELPNINASPLLVRLLGQHAETILQKLQRGSPFLQELTRLLLSLLQDGEPSLPAVAKRLGLSTRTLQRRIAQEETSFSAQLDEVRRSAAQEYLQKTRHGISEISFLVGFSEQAAFHRAFVRWTGETPTNWRRSHAK